MYQHSCLCQKYIFENVPRMYQNVPELKLGKNVLKLLGIVKVVIEL